MALGFDVVILVKLAEGDGYLHHGIPFLILMYLTKSCERGVARIGCCFHRVV